MSLGIIFAGKSIYLFLMLHDTHKFMKSMYLKNFVGIEKAKSIDFSDKLLVKILDIEKVISIKKGKKNFELWKFFIFDYNGIIELFSEKMFDIEKGNLVEIFNIKVFYYRGKIKIFGSIKEIKNCSQNFQFSPNGSKKNFSTFLNKTNLFSKQKNKI